MDALYIDGQNIGYAAQRSPTLTAGGEETQAIYYTLRCLKTLRDKYPNTPLFMLWDDRAQWRYDIHPGYKEKRKEDPEGQKMRESFNRQRKTLNKLLLLLGITQVKLLGYEADDIAGLFVKHAMARGQHVGVVSSDKDWLQLVSTRCTWIDVINDRQVDHRNFVEFTGANNAHQYLQAKAIQGDTSDCIDGIPGLGEKACLALFNNFKDVHALYAHWEEHGPYKGKANCPEGMSRYSKKLNEFCDPEGPLRERFDRNVRLMDLLNVPRPARDALVKVPGYYDLNKFADECARLAFASITGRIQEWSVFEPAERQAA